MQAIVIDGEMQAQRNTCVAASSRAVSLWIISLQDYVLFIICFLYPMREIYHTPFLPSYNPSEIVSFNHCHVMQQYASGS